MSANNLIYLYSTSGVTSPNLQSERSVILSIVSDCNALADKDLAAFSAFRTSYAEQWRQRYKRAAEMLREWSSQDPAYDEAAGSELDQALKNSRTKFRKA